MRLDAVSVAGSITLGALILKFIARVISDGRVTIPEEIRKLLGISSGDYVSCEVESVSTLGVNPPPNPGTQARAQTDSEQ